MKQPDRKPLILSYDEMRPLDGLISRRHDDLKRFLMPGQKGQRKLREALAIWGSIQRKMWHI